MLEGTQFAVGGCQAGALEFDVMLKRCGCQQFDTHMIGDHVGEVETQLRVAAHGCLATQVGARQRALINLDAGAVGLRVYRDGTGTHDDVAFRVCMGQRGDDGERKGGCAEQRLVHGSSIGIFKIYITNGNERPGLSS